MFKINIKTLGGSVTASRKAKFQTAILQCEKIIQSSEFRDWFIKQVEQKKFTQMTEGQRKMIPFDLYQFTQKPVSFDYYIQRKPWWKRFSSVIGYAQGDDIVTYSDHFDGMSMAGLISHIAHEILHLQGFKHSVEWNKERDYSVPYSAGNYIEHLARKMNANP